MEKHYSLLSIQFTFFHQIIEKFTSFNMLKHEKTGILAVTDQYTYRYLVVS